MSLRKAIQRALETVELVGDVTPSFGVDGMLLHLRAADLQPEALAALRAAGLTAEPSSATAIHIAPLQSPPCDCGHLTARWHGDAPDRARQYCCDDCARARGILASAAAPSGGMGGHQSARADKDEWLTPPELVRSLGPFDLDPCSPIARPWPTAANHFTTIDNGLLKAWTGRVWCNPPYGRETGRWLGRCAEHGNATALVFARTETADWVEHVWKRAHSVLFLYGRLFFHHVDGRRAASNSGAPSALIAYDEANTLALSHSSLLGKLIKL